MASINKFVRVQVILDTNAVFEAILWTLRKAKKPGARPALLELLQADAITGFAPTFLKVEILEKIEERSKRYDYSVDIARDIWSQYEQKIKFVEIGGPEQPATGGGDPKDVPYLKLQEKIKAPIISADGDIENMGGNSVAPTILVSIRKYSRESATVLKLNIMGVFVTTVPLIAFFKAASAIQKSIANVAGKTPSWVWVAASVLVLLLVVNPKSREWLKSKAVSLKSSIKSNISELLEALEPAFKEHQRATEAAESHYETMSKQGVV